MANKKKGPKVQRAPRSVSISILADMIGLSEVRIGQLVKEGMPKAGRGKYHLRESVRWYVEHLRKGQEKKPADGPSKADLEREILLQKLKSQRGETFDREAVLSVWTGAHARLAKGMDSFATNLGREFNLTGEDVKLIRDRLDEMRRDYVRDSKQFGEVVEGGEDAGATKAA